MRKILVDIDELKKHFKDMVEHNIGGCSIFGNRRIMCNYTDCFMCRLCQKIRKENKCQR